MLSDNKFNKKGGWVSMRKIGLLAAGILLLSLLAGCGGDTVQDQERKNMEFTVVSEDRLPDELKEIIDEKKESGFKITYADEGYLYICVGYGKQESGGYSIVVNELYSTENAIYINTNLLGPKAGSGGGKSPSYPYITAKVEYVDKTVVFD